MTHIGRKNVYLALPVLLIELATLWSLRAAYGFHEHPLVALLVAVSFSVLLIGSAVLVGQDINPMLRGLLIAGGVLLFLVQLISNVSLAYLHAADALPAEQLAQLWHVSPEEWRLTSSWIYGAALNLTGAVFWVALSAHYREEELRRTRRSELLEAYLRQEGGK